MKPIVISFYTLGTPYEEEAKKLIDSCLEFDIECDIAGITSQGSWEKNCAIKPFFIQQKLKDWNRPVLWVDADGVFKQRPDFNLFEGYDFAVRVNEFLPKTHESRIVSNTIFVRYNAPASSVIEKWCETTETQLNDKNRVLEFWDQTTLRDALDRTSSIRFLPMPLKFSKIFDFDDLFISEREVVLEHHQASRRHKHAIATDHCCH